LHIPKRRHGDQKDFEERNLDLILVDRVQIREARPRGFARQNLRTQMNYILHQMGMTTDQIKTGKVIVFLSEGESFRDRIATIAKYKGNRDAMPRPFHYHAVRDMLVTYYDALILQGEADDYISIEAANLRRRQQPYVVCSIDKDLDQIPGIHFNYQKHVFYHVSELEGEKKFWQQAFMGDATDNIKGIPGIGEAKSLALVEEMYETCKPEDYFGFVVDAYRRLAPGQYAREDGTPIDAYDAAFETCQLVKLLTIEDGIWMPPTTLKNSA